MYVCMYACTHVRMYACTHVRMYACTHVRMYARMHVCTYARMHVCMYACMHVCVYACMYVCIYINSDIKKLDCNTDRLSVQRLEHTKLSYKRLFYCSQIVAKFNKNSYQNQQPDT